MLNAELFGASCPQTYTLVMLSAIELAVNQNTIVPVWLFATNSNVYMVVLALLLPNLENVSEQF